MTVAGGRQGGGRIALDKTASLEQVRDGLYVKKSVVRQHARDTVAVGGHAADAPGLERLRRSHHVHIVPVPCPTP